MSAPASAWAPLAQPQFRMLWIATLVSNTGTWMHDIGAGWLMTTLSPSPLMVALVQTATTLPFFFLAIPSGALADIVDRRRYLVVLQAVLASVAALLALVTFTGLATPAVLLALTFGMGVGSAMMMPAWAAVTPEIVPRANLRAALALNSMSVNIARAIGPAVAGLIVARAGSGAVFALNALSYAGVIVVLIHWRRAARPSDLPAERFVGALRAGLRFARHSPELHIAMIRGFGFFLFASAMWALLPLIARSLPGGGPGIYGFLMASIGAGAVGGAALLPRIRARLDSDALVARATLVYALALGVLGLVHFVPALLLAAALAGAAWITVLSSLTVAAQLALPDWVRSRGLAVFMTVFMGTMALGSLAWGHLAETFSIQVTLLVAAGGLVFSALPLLRWRLRAGEALDLRPSMHWAEPPAHEEVTHDRGPVLVTIEYLVRATEIPAFLAVLADLSRRRLRDGAYGWGVFEHAEQPGRFVECFHVESWLEHLRQHERVTDADRILQEQIPSLLVEGSAPVVTHYVAPHV